MTPSLRPAALLACLAVALLGLLCAISVWSIVHRSGAFTTDAGRSESAATMFVVGGVALIAAGLITARHRRFVAALSVLVGFMWFAPAWEGWEGGPALARTAGMVAARLVFPMLAHLVIVAVTPSISRAASLVVRSTYALLGFAALLLALIRDPYLDPHCWTDCTTNRFVVSARAGLASMVETASLWVTAVAAAAVIVICSSSWSLPSIRRRHGLVLVGGVLLGLAMVAHSLITIRHGFEDPSGTSFAIVFLARCLAALLIAGGLLWSPLYSRRVRRAVTRVVAALDDAPSVGSLELALAQATRDPNLRVAYWHPAVGRYSDSDGQPAPDPWLSTKTVATPVVRNGTRIALISHTADAAELDRILGSDLRLALDNERLRAEVLAQINDLRNSRERIVEAGDERRRRLERNLHDGAQQRLLSLSYDLRRARATAAEQGNEDLSDLLDSALSEVAQAFAELRELAHGIFPVVLIHAGLGVAVASLAETAEIPIEVRCAIVERLSAPVETAVYVVVADGLQAASQSEATGATVTIVRREDHVVVDIAPDRAGVFAEMVHLADRVGAIGGTLLMSPSGLHAEIPCAL